MAANVTENRARSELTARETSIMPNVPGFGALMALIFAPSCVFFRDRHKLRYVAILCGLGEHPITKQPIYAEHDAVFNLDTDISVKDIEQVREEISRSAELIRSIQFSDQHNSVHYGQFTTNATGSTFSQCHRKKPEGIDDPNEK